MPQTDLFAVRDAVDLKDKQAHKIVAFAAMDDITGRGRPRWQWTHPTLARQLGISETFTVLMQSYLDYRHTRGISKERGIRLHQHGAELFQTRDNMPLDLLNIGPVPQREDKMAAVLKQAVIRKVTIEADMAVAIERTLARACGLSWEDLTNAFQRQRAAREQESAAA